MRLVTPGINNWPTVKRLRETIEPIESEGEFRFGFTNQSKLGQLQTLARGNVQIPIFTVEIPTRWREQYWGRKIHHSHGSDIALPGTRRWSRSDFWVEPIGDVKNEWRLHVFEGRVIVSGRKKHDDTIVCKHGVSQISCLPCWNLAAIIRSRKNGWRISRDQSPSEQVRTIAKQAVMVLEREYGAVDLLERNDGSAVVLEVNFAPAMDDRTMRQYVKALRQKYER